MTWIDSNGDIWGRIIDPEPSSASNDIQINTNVACRASTTGTGIDNFAVASAAYSIVNDRLMVVWTQQGETPTKVYAKIFDGMLNAIAPEYTITPGYTVPLSPDIACLADGRFIIAIGITADSAGKMIGYNPGTNTWSNLVNAPYYESSGPAPIIAPFPVTLSSNKFVLASTRYNSAVAWACICKWEGNDPEAIGSAKIIQLSPQPGERPDCSVLQNGNIVFTASNYEVKDELDAVLYNSTLTEEIDYLIVSDREGNFPSPSVNALSDNSCVFVWRNKATLCASGWDAGTRNDVTKSKKLPPNTLNLKTPYPTPSEAVIHEACGIGDHIFIGWSAANTGENLVDIINGLTGTRMMENDNVVLSLNDFGIQVTGTSILGGNTSILGGLDVMGSTTIGKLHVIGGTTTLDSTLNVEGVANLDGGIAVDTNKFTVAASTGNTTVAGALGVTGNTTVGGTLGVTGNTTVGENLTIGEGENKYSFPSSRGTENQILKLNGSGTLEWTTDESSDERVKQNVEIIDSEKSLKQINRLQPVQFEFIPEKKELFHINGHSGKHAGLIAQKTKDILPTIVTETPQKFEDGTPLYKIEYNELTPYLIGAIQALSNKYEQRFSALQQELAELKQKQQPMGAILK